LLYWVFKAFLTPVLHAAFRIRVTGRQHVPRRGPVIVASNHLSFIDSIFIPLVLRRRVTFVAKADYFTNWRTAWFFRGVGQIPIDRSGGTASDGALLAAARVLEAGGIFGIYPEGTRSPDGRLHRGHTGVARLALQTGAPIVPVALVGTRDIQPPGRRVPRFFRPIEVRFGEPIRVDGHPGVDGERLLLRDVTDEVMFTIHRLGGQPYVDRYAVKGTDGAGAEALPPQPVRIGTTGRAVEPATAAGATDADGPVAVAG
jgi:1-acyl-sn-glycerol-3-phosphate acyltransferase